MMHKLSDDNIFSVELGARDAVGLSTLKKGTSIIATIEVLRKCRPVL